MHSHQDDGNYQPNRDDLPTVPARQEYTSFKTMKNATSLDDQRGQRGTEIGEKYNINGKFEQYEGKVPLKPYFMEENSSDWKPRKQ
jgi:hypothetical protein